MDKHVYDVPLRVLLYEENGGWNAHALEMDVVGSGKTPKQAEEELKEAVMSQLSFAHQMRDLDLISHPAPKEYFNRWREAQQLMLANLVEKPATHSKKVRAICICVDKGEVDRALKRSSFVPEQAHA
jgi:predicted RNase H-like HicB family nuclease